MYKELRRERACEARRKRSAIVFRCEGNTVSGSVIIVP